MKIIINYLLDNTRILAKLTEVHLTNVYMKFKTHQLWPFDRKEKNIHEENEYSSIIMHDGIITDSILAFNSIKLEGNELIKPSFGFVNFTSDKDKEIHLKISKDLSIGKNRFVEEDSSKNKIRAEGNENNLSKLNSAWNSLKDEITNSNYYTELTKHFYDDFLDSFWETQIPINVRLFILYKELQDLGEELKKNDCKIERNNIFINELLQEITKCLKAYEELNNSKILPLNVSQKTNHLEYKKNNKAQFNKIIEINDKQFKNFEKALISSTKQKMLVKTPKIDDSNLLEINKKAFDELENTLKTIKILNAAERNNSKNQIESKLAENRSNNRATVSKQQLADFFVKKAQTDVLVKTFRMTLKEPTLSRNAFRTRLKVSCKDAEKVKELMEMHSNKANENNTEKSKSKWNIVVRSQNQLVSKVKAKPPQSILEALQEQNIKCHADLKPSLKETEKKLEREITNEVKGKASATKVSTAKMDVKLDLKKVMTNQEEHLEKERRYQLVSRGKNFYEMTLNENNNESSVGKSKIPTNNAEVNKKLNAKSKLKNALKYRDEKSQIEQNNKTTTKNKVKRSPQVENEDDKINMKSSKLLEENNEEKKKDIKLSNVMLQQNVKDLRKTSINKQELSGNVMQRESKIPVISPKVAMKTFNVESTIINKPNVDSGKLTTESKPDSNILIAQADLKVDQQKKQESFTQNTSNEVHVSKSKDTVKNVEEKHALICIEEKTGHAESLPTAIVKVNEKAEVVESNQISTNSPNNAPKIEIDDNFHQKKLYLEKVIKDQKQKLQKLLNTDKEDKLLTAKNNGESNISSEDNTKSAVRTSTTKSNNRKSPFTSSNNKYATQASGDALKKISNAEPNSKSEQSALEKRNKNTSNASNDNKQQANSPRCDLVLEELASADNPVNEKDLPNEDEEENALEVRRVTTTKLEKEKIKARMELLRQLQKRASTYNEQIEQNKLDTKKECFISGRKIDLLAIRKKWNSYDFSKGRPVKSKKQEQALPKKLRNLRKGFNETISLNAIDFFLKRKKILDAVKDIKSKTEVRESTKLECSIKDERKRQFILEPKSLISKSRINKEDDINLASSSDSGNENKKICTDQMPKELCEPNDLALVNTKRQKERPKEKFGNSHENKSLKSSLDSGNENKKICTDQLPKEVCEPNDLALVNINRQKESPKKKFENKDLKSWEKASSCKKTKKLPDKLEKNDRVLDVGVNKLLAQGDDRTVEKQELIFNKSTNKEFEMNMPQEIKPENITKKLDEDITEVGDIQITPHKSKLKQIELKNLVLADQKIKKTTNNDNEMHLKSFWGKKSGESFRFSPKDMNKNEDMLKMKENGEEKNKIGPGKHLLNDDNILIRIPNVKKENVKAADFHENKDLKSCEETLSSKKMKILPVKLEKNDRTLDADVNKLLAQDDDRMVEKQEVIWNKSTNKEFEMNMPQEIKPEHITKKLHEDTTELSDIQISPQKSELKQIGLKNLVLADQKIKKTADNDNEMHLKSFWGKKSGESFRFKPKDMNTNENMLKMEENGEEKNEIGSGKHLLNDDDIRIRISNVKKENVKAADVRTQLKNIIKENDMLKKLRSLEQLKNNIKQRGTSLKVKEQKTGNVSSNLEGSLDVKSNQFELKPANFNSTQNSDKLFNKDENIPTNLKEHETNEKQQQIESSLEKNQDDQSTMVDYVNVRNKTKKAKGSNAKKSSPKQSIGINIFNLKPTTAFQNQYLPVLPKSTLWNTLPKLKLKNVDAKGSQNNVSKSFQYVKKYYYKSKEVKSFQGKSMKVTYLVEEYVK